MSACLEVLEVIIKYISNHYIIWSLKLKNSCIQRKRMYWFDRKTQQNITILERENYGNVNQPCISRGSNTQIDLGHRTIKCSLVPGNNAKAQYRQTEETYVKQITVKGDNLSTKGRRIVDLKIMHAEEKRQLRVNSEIAKSPGESVYQIII